MRRELAEYAQYYGLISPLDGGELYAALFHAIPLTTSIKDSDLSSLSTVGTGSLDALDKWTITKEEAGKVARAIKAVTVKPKDDIFEQEPPLPPPRRAEDVITTRYCAFKTPRPLGEAWSRKYTVAPINLTAMLDLLALKEVMIDEEAALEAEEAITSIDELLDIDFRLTPEQAKAIGRVWQGLTQPPLSDANFFADDEEVPPCPLISHVRSPRLLPRDRDANIDLEEELYHVLPLIAAPTQSLVPTDPELDLATFDRWHGQEPIPSSSPISCHTASLKPISLPSSSPSRSASPYKPELPLLPRSPPDAASPLPRHAYGMLPSPASGYEPAPLAETRRDVCRELGVPSSPSTFELLHQADIFSPPAGMHAPDVQLPIMPSVAASPVADSLSTLFNPSAQSSLFDKKASGQKALTLSLGWRPISLPDVDPTELLDDLEDDVAIPLNKIMVSPPSSPISNVRLPSASPPSPLCPRSTDDQHASSTPSHVSELSLNRDIGESIPLTMSSPERALPEAPEPDETLVRLAAKLPRGDEGMNDQFLLRSLPLAALLKRHIGLRSKVYDSEAEEEKEERPRIETDRSTPIILTFEPPRPLSDTEETNLSYPGPHLRCIASLRLCSHPVASALRAANTDLVESPTPLPEDTDVSLLLIEPDLVLDGTSAATFVLLGKLRGEELSIGLNAFAIQQGFTRQLLVLIGLESTANLPPIRRQLEALQLGMLNVKVERVDNVKEAARIVREWSEVVRDEAIERADANDWWTPWRDEERNWLDDEVTEDAIVLMQTGLHFFAVKAILSHVSVQQLVDAPYDHGFKLLAGITGTTRAHALCNLVEANKRGIEASSDGMEVDELDEE